MAANQRSGIALLTSLLFLWLRDCTVRGQKEVMVELAGCQPEDEREEWRQKRMEFVVPLNQHQSSCQEGAQCNYSVSGDSTIQVLLQAGDSLRLETWGGSDPWPEALSSTPSSNGTSNSTSWSPGGEVSLRVSAVNEDTSLQGCPGSLQGDLLAEVSLQGLSEPANASVSVAPHLLPSGRNKLLVVYRDPYCATWWWLSVVVRLQECGLQEGFGSCSGHGRCLKTDKDKASSFVCRCCDGYMGRFCEERDACHIKPCTNGGFCVDIAEGLHGATYQCLCPHGFRGSKCEDRVSACDRRPCQNGGSCLPNGTTGGYLCQCPRGYAGADCETNVNDCQPNPCVHGVCEDAVAKYKCYCLPGYGGDHCEFEYDECDSSPCINGGQCEDLVAGYRCHCGPGYRGWRCQIKVDLCQPNPCPPPAQCVDRGNNYSCICHPGYNGPGCTKHYDPCYPSPCQNGGSCWPSLDSFFCSCRPGYTGDMCEELLYQPRPLAHTLEDSSVHGALQDSSSGSTGSGSGSGSGSRAGSSAGDGPGGPGSNEPGWGHLHHLYIAAATLAGACAIVLLVVAICHCKVNKTYLQVTRHLGCSDFQPHKIEDHDKFALNLAGSASERRLFADGVYEATCVDIADCSSLSAPLIR